MSECDKCEKLIESLERIRSILNRHDRSDSENEAFHEEDMGCPECNYTDEDARRLDVKAWTEFKPYQIAAIEPDVICRLLQYAANENDRLRGEVQILTKQRDHYMSVGQSVEHPNPDPFETYHGIHDTPGGEYE